MHWACSCYFEVKCCPLSCFLEETLKTELRLVLLLLVKLIHVVPVLLKSLIVFQKSLPFLLLPLNLFLWITQIIISRTDTKFWLTCSLETSSRLFFLHFSAWILFLPFLLISLQTSWCSLPRSLIRSIKDGRLRWMRSSGFKDRLTKFS